MLRFYLYAFICLSMFVPLLKIDLFLEEKHFYIVHKNMHKGGA